MAHTYELEATLRGHVEKGSARALRRDGKIPAVIYGGNEDPLPIAIGIKETTLKLHAGGFMTQIATITVDGKKERVLARDYQLDPVRDFLVHVDFLRVGANTRLTVDVPVHFINEEQSSGIKRGGVLNVVRHTVELECPASEIPESIKVDLSGLDINDSAHISSVTLPENVTPAITDRDFTIATIAAPAGLKDEAEGEGEAEESAAPSAEAE
ncbi:50S ribosomal protein L25/general stress protein Ctc [Breoghania sp.]|uniref:50S ribosomal protein L25/general stress protein Ctc n=1 Tax=Breoghania sp. TaxID=2065378 RepID=UPI0026396989|nr:50S ribosomal protein L25/general stress protein Ctc [Breoghania sp.]MDJ0931572.1 50S ribosomal protein L25/general stress protein Ctc [Breoghania sp.]